jgi:hypothetical protein
MSRDGYLIPPDVADQVIDEALSGHWDHGCVGKTQLEETEAELADPPGFDEHIIECSVERLLAKGQRAVVMELFARLIREHKLDQFNVAAE